MSKIVTRPCIDCGRMRVLDQLWGGRCYECNNRLMEETEKLNYLKCSKCGEYKPKTEFPRDNSAKTRQNYSYWCKNCHSNRSKDYKEKVKKENPSPKRKRKKSPNLAVKGKKICTKCGVKKNVTQFHKSNATKDGLQTWCKLCKSKYTKDKISREANLNNSIFKLPLEEGRRNLQQTHKKVKEMEQEQGYTSESSSNDIGIHESNLIRKLLYLTSKMLFPNAEDIEYSTKIIIASYPWKAEMEQDTHTLIGLDIPYTVRTMYVTEKHKKIVIEVSLDDAGFVFNEGNSPTLSANFFHFEEMKEADK